MVLSAGGFAVYRAESHIFTALVPRFGDFRRPRHRRAATAAWVNSHRFRIAGLDPVAFAARIERECRSGGDFLRIMMESIATQQGVSRWADCTPEHLLWARQIKTELPTARVIHILRDGRDVALSMARQRWIRPLPGDPTPPLLVAGLYWEWLVTRGRAEASHLRGDYTEVKFEDLVRDPVETLTSLGRFIEHDLDYDRIQAAGIGSVSRPNTSFQEQGTFNPVGRWRDLPPRELAPLEALIGETLSTLGYPLVTDVAERPRTTALVAKRRLYHAFFGAKRWLKQRTPMGRVMVSLQILDG